MTYPKITIITPSLNQGQFIEKTIQSVVSQNYPNLEYFIIDGGSTDNTLDVIKKYEKYITYWVSEPDKGQSDAINKGLKMATGDIINWLNSDDYYEPYALFKVANAFNNHRIKVVAGKGRVFSEQKQPLDFVEETIIYPHNLSKTIGWGNFAQPETFFHRSVVEQMGLLDTSLHYLMDRDWWVRYLFMFGLEGVIKIHDELVNFRVHNKSKTVLHSKQVQTEYNSFYYALANMYRLYGYAYLLKNHLSINKDLKLTFRTAYSEYLVEQAVNYFVLLQAAELYQKGNISTAQHFLEEVKPQLLQAEDRATYKKMRFRNKYIPRFLGSIFQNKEVEPTPKLKTQLVVT